MSTWGRIVLTLGLVLGACGDDTGHHSDAGSGSDGDSGSAAIDAAPRVAPDLGANVQTERMWIANARGELIDTVIASPVAGGPHPAVLLAHGSGGLFRLPASGDTNPCSDRMESQFERWATRLVGLGFVVAMPDSFGSRGFCDFNTDARKDVAFPPIAGDIDGKTRRIVARIYDADAVLREVAARTDVRPDRVGLLGFSNGASVVALYLHHRLPAAWTEFAASADGVALGVPIPALSATTVPVLTGVAYYPGCGFDGVLPFSTDLSDVDEFYYPASPLRILIGSLDSLLDHCSITQTGTREMQADAYAGAKSVADQYAITIYNNADHGFDAAGCETSTPGADPDLDACREALPIAVGLLTPLTDP